MDLQAPAGGLEGLGRFLGATSNIGLINKLRLRFAEWKARKQAQRFVAVDPSITPRSAPLMPVAMMEAHDFGIGPAHNARFTPGGAYGQVGEQYSPQFLAKEEMIAYLTGSGSPADFAEAQAATSRRNWTSPWWNSR
jgi:hypothetical protein